VIIARVGLAPDQASQPQVSKTRRGGAWGVGAGAGSLAEPVEEALTVSIGPVPSRTDSALLITVAEAARRLSIARSHLYLLLQRGLLRSVHLGRSRRIWVGDLESFVARLAAEEPEVNG
jgi:excisionase family DNA binding protein